MAVYDPLTWILLFTGLAVLAAAVGELRAPGAWLAACNECQKSAALRLLAGFQAIGFGAFVFLLNPVSLEDRLSLLLALISGLALVKGTLLLAAGERILKAWHKLLTKGASAFAGTAALIGAALIFTAISKI